MSRLTDDKLHGYEAVALTPHRAVTIPTMDFRAIVAELVEHRADRDRRRRNAQPYGTSPLEDTDPSLPPSIEAWKPGEYQLAIFVRHPGGSTETSVGLRAPKEEADALFALRDAWFKRAGAVGSWR